MAKDTGKKITAKIGVKDPEVVYVRKQKEPASARVTTRSKRRPAGHPNHSLIEKIEFIRNGVTKKFLVAIKEKTDLDYDELAKVLSVGRATLINKQGNTPFNAALSDRIVGLSDLYEYGYQVFGDVDNFNAWMLTSNHALGGTRPYELIDTQYGKEEVKHLIGRIDYGVFS